MDAVLAFLLLLNAILLIINLSKPRADSYNLIQIKYKLKKIMSTQAELTDKINSLTSKVNKVATEIQALKDALANQPGVTPELQAAVDSLDAAITSADDLNPDA